MRGVVRGVRDYGNRMGIPTVNGAIQFDETYIYNPLVFCGTAGVIPIKDIDKEMRPGLQVIAVGGRTGRDGLKGATFSSAELDRRQPRGGPERGADRQSDRGEKGGGLHPGGPRGRPDCFRHRLRRRRIFAARRAKC